MVKIQIAKIRTSPDNPRKEFNEVKIREIGNSILKHGQIHSVIVRRLSDGFYELVTGELRFRGCQYVGLEEIDADIRTLSDSECRVLRLIENVHREDLTDAEKGDAVIELAEVTDKTYRDIADKELTIPEQTVYQWIRKANRISPKIRQFVSANELADFHTLFLLKYPHTVQDLLATFIVDWNQKNPKNKITATNIGNFCKEYDKDPNVSLKDLAQKITGFVPVVTWQLKDTLPPPAPRPKPPKPELPESERCKATTRKGARCNGKRLPNTEYCSRHSFVRRGAKPKPQKKPPFKPEQIPPLPEGQFDVICADPPWKYDVDFLDASPDIHYPTLELEEICSYKVPSAENAILFLWATNPLLPEALKVMEAWGFKYKTNMVWDKEKIGLGFYFRGQHELLLVGTKGNIKPPDESCRFSSVLRSEATNHSEKPQEAYKHIEKMYPGRTRLELFNPDKREGWICWGVKA